MMNKVTLVAAGISAAFALASISGGGAAAQDAPPDLPPGPGHDTVAATCVACHRSTQVTDRRMSESDWSETLDRMIGLGAQFTEEDRAVILEYLSTNFGMSEAKTDKRRAGG